MQNKISSFVLFGIIYNTIVILKIVIDTNVFISALRSSHGASYRLLRLVGKDRFTTYVSVPLVLVYESTAKRQSRSIGLLHSDIDDILDYLCMVSEHRRIFFLWRPFLKDPKDDMVPVSYTHLTLPTTLTV